MKYNKNRRLNIYTALEDMDFHWDLKEVLEFDQLWREGQSLNYISNHFNRDMDECAILLMDRAKQGYIEPRENGLKG